MNKKASIATFHCVPNYGAVLQAYGLQTMLKEYFADVEIVDYRPNTITKEYKAINFYSVFSILASLWSIVSFKKKKKRFHQFENDYLQVSGISSSDSGAFKNYKTHYLFLGSDQIWNPEITKGFDKVYFGCLGNKEFTKIAYAASIGKGNYSKEEKEEIIKLLKEIDHVSVREKEAAEILQNELNICAETVVDPTILAGKRCFEPLVQKVEYENYLFFYSLNGYEESSAMAEKVSRYLNFRQIELSGRRKPIIRKNHIAIYDAGPIEFLSLIYHSEFVVTDSFHGTVFALLFHKPFICIPHKTRGGRIRSLMNIVGLKHRMTEVFDSSIVLESIDWSKIDRLLNVERQKSKDYIFRAVGENDGLYIQK